MFRKWTCQQRLDGYDIQQPIPGLVIESLRGNRISIEAKCKDTTQIVEFNLEPSTVVLL